MHDENNNFDLHGLKINSSSGSIYFEYCFIGMYST